MTNLAIIPARGGSKRIPRKNIKEFHGKPIIAYSIEVALKSCLFNEVMVSTDDPEIARIAKKYGAKVPFYRSKKNADDVATTSDVLIEVIENYEKREASFTHACCIYPTAPFITKNSLELGLEKLIEDKTTSVFPVVPFTYPIWRGFKKTEKGKFTLVWPKYINTRSQDLEDIYHDAGQWYWFRVDDFKTNKNLFVENTSSIVINLMEMQDIDNIHDWHLAELKYEHLQSLK